MRQLTTCLLLLWVILGQAAWGQTDPSRLIYQQQDPNGENYLENRKALVGRNCVVNKLINVVGVGSWVQDLNNLTDEDLDNVATFPKIVSAGVTVNPVVSVRDLSSYYAKDTKAGFCLVASSGNSVLSLDVIKALSIQFFRDGEAVGDPIDVFEGQDAAGVGLSLISVPGSDDACTYVSAPAPDTFDEICLVDAGGVNLSVGDVVKIKYAFVGEPREIKLTTNGVKSMGDSYYLETAKGWNPVLLGIPFPLLSGEIEKLTNDNLDDYAALTPIIAAGYQGGVKLCAANSNSQEETFKAGSEIGFKWVNGAALDLDVGAWIRIILFDRNGNKVQEETVSGDVVGLGVGSGGIGTSSIVANVDYSGAEIRFHTVLSVSVGMMGVYYGFVREKPDVEHHCDINPTINTNVCEEQTSFQLESNPELSVTWTLGQHPDGSKVSVTPGGYVTNMDIAGDYEFIATAADGCTESVILTLGGFGEIEPCGTPLINLEGQEGRFMLSQDNNDDSEGALLSISNLKNEGNILNGDPDDYATCTSGLGIGTNLNLIGVETVKEGDYIIDGSQYQQGAKIRIGFVVEMETTGLSLDLLTFFQIRTFSDGKSDYHSVIEESDVLSVGLGGSNNHVQKIRFSILVPAYDDEGNPRKIDEFMLWRSGALNLNISTLNIYYPFIENDTSGSCSDPMGCAIPLSVEMGTTINSNQTQMAGAVDVARVADNLSFLVDNDPNFETAMTVVNSVTVGGGTTIAVKMGHTLDFRHQLVLVTDNKTYTAGVKAGSWLTIETFYRGVATGDKYEKWDVLGANVIGYGDKNFLLVQPQAKYDEVRLTIAGIAGVLDIQSFYGFFLRGDIDGDGLPDCQDPSSCETTIEGIEVTHICQGDQITIKGKGLPQTNYQIILQEQGVNETFTTDEQGFFTKKYTLNVAGRYTMLFLDGSGNTVASAVYTVHPNETTWKKDPVNTDWNEWTNWTNGSPYCCTNVIIPSDATRYPVLDGTVSQGDEYCCNYIHFEPRSAVEQTPKLNYNQAWVEMELKPNRYYLLSAPLKNMFTGDMFIPEKGTPSAEYFEELNGTNTPQNRFNPRIYQRLWASSAPGRLMNGGEATLGISETRWSKNFNHLAYAYNAEEHYGNGFSLWIDNGDLPDTSSFRFRFPKAHTSYNYYEDYSQTLLDVKEENLSRENKGRFAYETDYAEDDKRKNVSFTYEREREGTTTTEQRTVYTGNLPLAVTLKAEEATTYFVAANPFMSPIDVRTFLDENSDIISVKVYDGNTTNSAVTADGELMTTSDGLATIQPMEAFFVEVASKSQEQTIIYTEDMLASTDKGRTINSASFRASGLAITAETARAKASTLLTKNAVPASETLIDNEVKPIVALFSLFDNQAFDIHSFEGRQEIPLGTLLAEPDTVTLRFDSDDPFLLDEWVLEDRATGIQYELGTPIMLTDVSTSVGRFVLRDQQVTANEPVELSEVYLSLRRGHLSVSSTGEEIREVRVSAMDGRTAHVSGPVNRTSYEADLHKKGVLFIVVSLADGKEETFKILAL